MSQEEEPRHAPERHGTGDDIVSTLELSATPEAIPQTSWAALVSLIVVALYFTFLVISGASWEEVLLDGDWPYIGLAGLAIFLLFQSPPLFRHVRVFRHGDALWVSLVRGWVRVPLERVLRVSPANFESDRSKQGIRIEYANEDGSQAEIAFKPHPRFARNGAAADALREYLEREVVRAQTALSERKVESLARQAEGVGLDFRASEAREDNVPNDATPPADSRDGAVLSKSSTYMRRWYPWEWLFWPVILLVGATIVGALLQWWPWPMFGGVALVAATEWKDQCMKKARIIADVALRGDWLWFSCNGTTTRIALADVLDVSVPSRMFRSGREVVILRYVRGSHLVEAGFLPKDAPWFGWKTVGECLERLRERVAKARAPGPDPRLNVWPPRRQMASAV